MDSTVLIESLRVELDSDKPTEKAWGKLIPTSKFAKPLSLYKDSTTFGRAETCDVVYSQGGVSGLHCTITKGGEVGAWVTDHSTNGTFINGERIGKGNKKLLEPNTTFDLLFKGKGDENNLSFIYIDLSKSDEGDEGPKKHYYISKVLGTYGNFATVKLCIHKETGDSYALKIIEKKKFLMSNATRREDALMDEVKILQRLQHENIIGIHEVFDTDSTLYLVLELVTGGELFDKIIEHGQFTEERSRNYFKQMLEATNYLHNQGIAHRDLKPENILMKDKENDIIKLSDFGLSRTVDEASFMKTMCGTPQYVAPEILTSSKTGGYGMECDVWSLGVILYIMLVGYPPFNTERPEAVFEQIKTGRFDFPAEHWSGISQDVQNLIRRMLTVDPKKRITTKEILEHSWVKDEPNDTKRKRPEDNDAIEDAESPEQKRRKTDEQ